MKLGFTELIFRICSGWEKYFANYNVIKIFRGVLYNFKAFTYQVSIIYDSMRLSNFFVNWNHPEELAEKESWQLRLLPSLVNK